MTLSSDIKSVIEDLRACKPPYKCPFDQCEKIYKTFPGIASHISVSHQLNIDENYTGKTNNGECLQVKNGLITPFIRLPSSPKPFFTSPAKDSFVYDETNNVIEFEAEGRLHRLSIFDALHCIDRVEWEKTILQETTNQDNKLEEGQNGSLVSIATNVSSTPKSSGPLSVGHQTTGSRGGGHRKRRGHHRFSSVSTNRTCSSNANLSSPRSSLNIDVSSSHLTNSSECQQLNIVTDGASSGFSSSHSQLTSAEQKKHVKLPEPKYTIIEDYEISDASPLPKNRYIKFVERSVEELDKRVEYDMDEEDMAWLKLINKRRMRDKLTLITEDMLELLMDRLEKESFFHVQNSGGLLNSMIANPVDDDAVCCVCMDGECSNTNVILFCDLCNLAVHQECYGVPYIPEGQWLCRRCLQSPSRSVECCLCPNKGGAFKQTDDGRWAHVVCGLWIPEVRFANTVFLEPIDSIEHIPSARWKLSCRVCKQRSVGACIQCHKTNCYTAFHVTCGLLSGLHMKMDTVRESVAGSGGGLSVTVRKTAFCDIHTPHDSDCQPQLDDIASLGISTAALPNNNGNGTKQRTNKTPVSSSDKKGSCKAGGSPVVPILFRGLMNFTPQCPWDKVQEIAALIDVEKKNHFFQRLLSYWTLKRQTRNGVPLIKRLQFTKATNVDPPDTAPSSLDDTACEGEEDGEDDSVRLDKIERNSTKKKDKKNKKDLEKSNANKLKKEKFKMTRVVEENDNEPDDKQTSVVEKVRNEFAEMMAERKLLRKLRQDVERVRLLCELIRKREQRKRELVINKCESIGLRCWPWILFLRDIVDSLEEIDSARIFAFPVSKEEVPDYFDHIFQPMDLQTIREKVDTFQYKNLLELESDVNKMVSNCLSYNEKDTIFYRHGVRMRDQGGSVLRQAKRMAEQSKFDTETGLHVKLDEIDLKEIGPDGSSCHQDDKSILKNIDEFFNSYIYVSSNETSDDDENDEEGDTTDEKTLKDAGDVQVTIKEEQCPLSDDELLERLLHLLDEARALGKANVRNKRVKMIRTQVAKIRRKISIGLKGGDGVKNSLPRNVSIGATSEATGSFKRKNMSPLSNNSSLEDDDTDRDFAVLKCNASNIDACKSSSGKSNVSSSLADNGQSREKSGGVNRRNAVLFTRKKQAAAVEAARSSSANNNYKNDAVLNDKTVEKKKEKGSNDGESVKIEDRRTRSSKKYEFDEDLEGPDDDESSILRGSEEVSPSSFSLLGELGNDGNDSSHLMCETIIEMRRHATDGGKKSYEHEELLKMKENELVDNVVKPSTSSRWRCESAFHARHPSTNTSSSNKNNNMLLSDTDDEDLLMSANRRFSDHPFNSPPHISSSSPPFSSPLPPPTPSNKVVVVTSSPRIIDESRHQHPPFTLSDLKSIQLEPLDLVWAKCRGYPWYPALIINPKMPRTGYLHNGVPIPAPPQDVLDMSVAHTQPHYLILFFDVKRTWQWVVREKLEPLGVDPNLDKDRLLGGGGGGGSHQGGNNKKSAERKGVKKAYQEAIMHRSRVIGEMDAI